MRPLPVSLSLDQPNFALLLQRLRRLANTDNKRIATLLRVPPGKLAAIDRGRTPDYPTGAALIALVRHFGGDLTGL